MSVQEFSQGLFFLQGRKSSVIIRYLGYFPFVMTEIYKHICYFPSAWTELKVI